MVEPSLSALTSALRSFVTKVFKHANRLSAERRAGQIPLTHPHSIMDESLNETLDRIRGGRIDSGWWASLLDRIEQPYIAPDFLTKPSLQEWLREDSVASDLKTIAKWRIMETAEDEAALRGRLAQSYSNQTGEAPYLAAGSTDIVIAILMAGYIATIRPDQRALAGMIQAGFSRFGDDLDRLIQSTFPVTDPITRQMHTEYAVKELTRILALRAFDPVKARTEIQKLHDRVDDGDLSAADNKTRNSVRYRLARLCAGDAKTLGIAKKIRPQITDNDPEIDLAIVDALICSTDGDLDGAIRILRDHDDPDSRSTLFALLLRKQDTDVALDMFDDKIGDFGARCFTAFGWRTWACSMAKVGRWEEAAQRLIGFDGIWADAPILAFFEAIINAQLLLPKENRRMISEPPLFGGITPNQGVQAEEVHVRASACLELAQSGLDDVGKTDLERSIVRWRCWLRFMDPRGGNVQDVHDEIRRSLESDDPDIDLMPFAFAFGVSFDPMSLRNYLSGRKNLGGLNDEELRAECLLFLSDIKSGEMGSRDFLIYIERHQNRLDKIVPNNLLMAARIGTLVEDNQTERARALLTEADSGLDKAEVIRLSAMIDAHDGVDPRKKLEQAYQETENITDLGNLIGCLQEADDTESLLPLLERMVELQRTVANAWNLVVCLGKRPFFHHERIVEFLEANSDLAAQSPELQSAKAWSLFATGRLSDARELNESLGNTGQQAANVLALDINIAVASGDWERLPAIVEREWPRRNEHDAKTLLTLAQVAGHRGYSTDRALALARLAIDNAPDDPRALSNAIELHFRLGRDEEIDPGWLMRVVQHSSTDDGPVWSMDLQTVVAEWMPKRREQFVEIEQHWLAGKIPTEIAASILNTPLTHLLIQTPEFNAGLIDRRMSEVIPMVLGGRPQVEMQENLVVGLDITSILVLYYSNLLKIVLDVFPRIKFAPEVMQCLFEEHGRVRYHQPSQLRASQQVLTLCNQNRLQVVDGPEAPPEAIAEEVGRELGTLLQTARQNHGKVICVLPIHRPDSLLEREADTSDWSDFIISVSDFCRLLHQVGLIDAETHSRAQLFLRNQGQSEGGYLEPSILDRPIYLDQLALSYLQGAKVLESIAVGGLDLRIHSNVPNEMDELVRAGESGSELAAKIEEIRHVLRGALESGRASYLPTKVDPENQVSHFHGQFKSTRSLLASAADCDVLCIDDRSINSKERFIADDKVDSPVPIACVLDILRYLARNEHITQEHHWAVRHKLRAGGFIVIPFEADELIYWLKLGLVKDGHLTEGAEVRAIRQSLVRARGLGPVNPAEMSTLQTDVPNACMSVVRFLWTDESLSMESATALSNWIWRHLIVAVLGDSSHVEKENQEYWIRELMLHRLMLVLLPSSISSQNRRAGYTDWVETSILQPLRQANSDLVEEALTFLCDAIFDQGDDIEHYGHVFLEQLPEASRRYLLDRYPERMEQWGFLSQGIFTVSSAVSISTHKLFRAVREMFSGAKSVSLQSISGNEVTLALDGEDGNIVLEWSKPETDSSFMVMPQLSLLSPDPAARTAALCSMVEGFGPAAPDFTHLLHDMELREPEEHELSAVFHEASRGVAAIQESFLRKCQFSLDIGANDILPQDMAYFEKFVGERPETSEPESYIRDVLVPWRTTLLGRDLERGLDICCLGALRDDLCPGQWMHDLDDDVVWESLSTGNADAVPISLLGALDAALYRQHDERFRGYAERAVTKLCDDTFGYQDGSDVYRLLWIFMRFVFNRVNLIENGSGQPGFWKRMCAWMQAQFVVRALLKGPGKIDMDRLEELSMSKMALVGAYAELVDAREEPMLLFTERSPLSDLRCEVLGRLIALRARHEAEGRSIPRSGEIDRALEREQKRGNGIKCFFPGPLEGHRRPVVPAPGELLKLLKETELDAAVPESWHFLTTASHLHALDDSELATARNAVAKVPHSVDQVEMESHLLAYELASIVAKTNRDILLADAVADAVTRTCKEVSNEHHIHMIIMICLQAAAAFEEHDAWFDWLEKKIAIIASCLPGPPSKAVRIFLEHLDAMETILPVDSWFHRRARSIAAAGAELRP